MPRLFDDTLVIWHDSARRTQDKTLWVREEHELDAALIEAVRNFLVTHPGWTLVVWSGGGVSYAARWAAMAFGDTTSAGAGYLVMSKDTTEPVSGDICVDDMPIAPRNLGVTVVHPAEFTARYS